jgi:hypothetical protein
MLNSTRTSSGKLRIHTNSLWPTARPMSNGPRMAFQVALPVLIRLVLAWHRRGDSAPA